MPDRAVKNSDTQNSAVKKLLVILFSSLGEVADWLANDPMITAVMPSEMSSLGQRFRDDS